MVLSATEAEGDLTRAYSQAGVAWAEGPSALIYDRLSDVLVEHSPVPVAGSTVVDLGAGTGAASRALARAGAGAVVAVDPAPGMLAVGADVRPPAVAGDARAIPLATSSVDLVVAAFCLNHLADPVDGLVEIRRVLRPGGGLVSGTYAADDHHPVKEAVEAALTEAGWVAPDWYRWIREHVAVGTASPEQVRDQALRAGLVDVQVDEIAVPFDHLGPDDLVRWRLGMAQHADFVSSLSRDDREMVSADAVTRLSVSREPLKRSVITLRARR